MSAPGPSISTPRLLIADHGPTRMGIRMALDRVVHVVAEASEVRQAIRAAERHAPDVCIVGLELNGGGIEAVRGICAVASEARVLLLACEDDPELLLSAVRAGAIGYLPSGTDAPALRRVVAAAARGEAVIPRAMVAGLAREVRDCAHFDDRLTMREAQVLTLLRKGHSTGEVAESLSISPITVRRHISILKQKLGDDGRVRPESVRQTVDGRI